MKITVYKYGGTSVGTIPKIQAIAKRLQQELQPDSKILVVVSAMAHQTDELLSQAHHLTTAPEQRELDMLLTAGERISMSFLALALQAQGVPALTFTGSQAGILTDDNHGNARILDIKPHRLFKAFEQVPLVIVAGFQGVSSNTKDVTTLGRGGSDLTAIALAHKFQTSCALFKDVEGIYTAHPQWVPQAYNIASLSWAELAYLCRSGSNVIHHRAADFAWRHKVPLKIRSCHNPQSLTTEIGDKVMEGFHLSALTGEASVALIELGLTADTQTDISSYSKVFNFLKEAVKPPQIQQIDSQDGLKLRLVITKTLADKLVKWVAGLKEVQLITHRSGLSCHCLIGTQLWQEPQLVARATEALSVLPILADLQTERLSLVCDGGEFEKQQRMLHSALLKKAIK